ncbi:Protein kinase domain [Macleaya cordata]|uniref:non-specific serine/threonine protein kinase n=1 Tax=Macleaya cordata TaxID=56857 RepID=A0A200QBV2_MACCD|nr:Protein kinase domain [Macleaya cordata]
MEEKKKTAELDLENLIVVKVLGKGAMGTVFLVIDRVNDPSGRCPFALKVVEKSNFHTKFDADRRARWEVSVLARLSDPFLPTLLGTLETDEFLAWAIPYCPGGDLNVLRYRQTDRIFSPSVIRFYVAEIVCALEYLHRMNVVYRDLKPENVLIQQSGHVTLTDFDLSRILTPRTSKPPEPTIPVPENRRKHRRNLTRLMLVVTEKGLKKAKSARVSPVSRRRPSFSNGERSNSFVGTEEYVSPEVVRGDGHEFAVDWWALGILIYEMMYGETPFRGKNRKETFRNVVMKPPEFIGKRTALTDLIERLLEKDPTKRLGYKKGAVEIKEHEFFRGLKWDLLTEVSRPPFLALTEEETVKETLLTASTGMNVREYFKNLRQQAASIPQTPSQSTLNSPSSDCHCRRNVSSFTEF